MSDHKPVSLAGVFLGIALFIVYVALAISAWALRPAKGWSIEWLAIIELGLLVGFLLGLVFLKPLQAIILWMSNLKAARFVTEHFRNESAHDSKENAAQTGQTAPEQLRALRDTLRADNGWRWRYRQPWLLLTGDDGAISRLLPELATSGWTTAADTVLLWSRSGQNGQPDGAWLRQLYKLRCRRPVDAIVLVTDSHADLTADRHVTHIPGYRLASTIRSLRWHAPVFVLEATQPSPGVQGILPVVACEFPVNPDGNAIDHSLHALRDQLSDRGVFRLCKSLGDVYLAKLSCHLDTHAKVLAEWVASIPRGLGRLNPVRGIAFAPYPLAGATVAGRQDSSANLPLWQHLGETARHCPGRRTVNHPTTIWAGLALLMIGLWTAGMLISGLRNTRDVSAATKAIQSVQAAPNAADRLHALLALQQQIEHYEYRTQHHAPLLTRFGLNRDAQILTALWKPYTQAVRQQLITPVQQTLEASLTDLGQLQTTSLDDRTIRWAMSGRDGLKAYLMLAEPERAEPAFLASQLAQAWTTEARITPGEQQDLAERLFRFYAQHLKANPDWKIDARPELVAGARQTLLAVIGARNAQDTVYQQILDGIGSKYPDQTLASLTLGTDTRGLLRASAIVPGVFTRQAYEGYIADAIEEAVKRRDVSTDWVLAGAQAGSNPPNQSADELRVALTQQYFADYAERWQDFMNALQWEPAATLPAAIGQLKLLADARQSPVIALMKSLEYQGGAGMQKSSLSDALVNKAKDMLTSKSDTSHVARAEPVGPLDAAFGPVLRLVGQSGQGNANSDLSLQRFLERATALRLRLQQVNGSPDADEQARQMAQALFQGKGSELADTRAYAELMAASLGTEWAGMGETLFVRPITQATQTIVLPAQASLNDLWNRAVVGDWNQSFAGRYPFADTANDASLPEFAQFVRPQGGRIQTFLATQLAGVLELQGNQWVPAAGARGITFDPEFLKFINLTQRIGARLLVQGEPQYRFELKPVPTPGLTDTVLIIDGQKLHYFNQREGWQRMAWPSNNLPDLGTRLQWQTETGGTNKGYEFAGRFGLLRMLARGHIQQIDGATYQIGWPAVPDTGAPAIGPDTGKAPEIQFQMRSESGAGVLDLLSLLGLKISPRVFLDARAGTVADAAPSPARRSLPGRAQ